MSFSERAARLAGLATVLFGWRPADFWNATPAELASVLDALAPDGGAGADPATIGRLMEQFPDG